MAFQMDQGKVGGDRAPDLTSSQEMRKTYLLRCEYAPLTPNNLAASPRDNILYGFCAVLWQPWNRFILFIVWTGGGFFLQFCGWARIYGDGWHAGYGRHAWNDRYAWPCTQSRHRAA